MRTRMPGRLYVLSAAYVCLFCIDAAAAQPTIELWYGDEQRFGHNGDPQPLANLLGSVSDPGKIAYLEWRLNGEWCGQLWMGADQHRLSLPGAFNIEIPRDDFREGPNEVEVRARTRAGENLSKRVAVHYTPDRKWPLPYRIDWSGVSHLQDVAEAVDGKWAVSPEGVRTLDPYYDRVLAVGDSSWRDYEAVVDVTYHRVLPEMEGRELKGPPYLDHAHASLVLRWNGHTDDGWQPRRDWTNLGAIVMLRTDVDRDGSRWWIHLGQTSEPTEPQHWGDWRSPITPGVRYRYRMRVETTQSGGARYATKAWQAEDAEPPEWDLVAEDPNESVDSGALLLVVHHSDVTFGNLQVTPLE